LNKNNWQSPADIAFFTAEMSLRQQRFQRHGADHMRLRYLEKVSMLRADRMKDRHMPSTCSIQADLIKK
jgi:hypothetical protein